MALVSSLLTAFDTFRTIDERASTGSSTLFSTETSGTWEVRGVQRPQGEGGLLATTETISPSVSSESCLRQRADDVREELARDYLFLLAPPTRRTCVDRDLKIGRLQDETRHPKRPDGCRKG